MKNEQQIFQAINPTVTDLGYEIVDIEITKKGSETTLTVFIDIPSGVSLDDCEKVHYAIDPVLDELDPSDGKPYVLNVSSPGLDRPFKKQRDYERNYGKEVEIKLYAPIKGKKIYEGTLISHDENVTVVNTDDKDTSIENTRIAFVRPLVKFE